MTSCHDLVVHMNHKRLFPVQSHSHHCHTGLMISLALMSTKSPDDHRDTGTKKFYFYMSSLNYGADADIKASLENGLMTDRVSMSHALTES